MDIIDEIREGLKKPHKTQSGLAAALGRQPSAVSAILKGTRQIKAKEIPIIRAYFQSPDEHITSESIAVDFLGKSQSGPVMVKLKGYVGAGSEAHFYAVSDEDYEEVEGPVGASDQTVAVEIRGTSWGPLMANWLVYYDDVRSPVTEDLLGWPCVVGLADDRILIKKIIRNKRGGYDLISNSANDPPIEDAAIEWAAKVKSMRPRS